MSSDPLHEIAQAQRERLFHVDFRACFLGAVRRADLMRRFGIAEAAATRDLALYRSLAPANLVLERSSKQYLRADAFRPLFAHEPWQSLHALISGTGDDAAGQIGPHLQAERPMRPQHLSLEVLSVVSRAVAQNRLVHLDYASLSRGRASRTIAPHAFVDTGLRWHVRSHDLGRDRFADFVLTRMANARLGDLAPPDSDRERDEQWMRIVPLELVPHPRLSHPEAVVADYGMQDSVLRLRLRAALVGYALQLWGVDTTPDHALEPARHQLWLCNHPTLYGVESLTIAPGAEA